MYGLFYGNESGVRERYVEHIQREVSTLTQCEIDTTATSHFLRHLIDDHSITLHHCASIC